jgi:hypothetical protein
MMAPQASDRIRRIQSYITIINYTCNRSYDAPSASPPAVFCVAFTPSNFGSDWPLVVSLIRRRRLYDPITAQDYLQQRIAADFAK